MIAFSQAFSWLNEGGGSHLSGAGRAILNSVANPALPQSVRQKYMSDLVARSQLSADLLEYPEALAYNGWYLREWGCIYDAVEAIDRAESIYQDLRETHRSAVCLWLSSNLKWMLARNDEALASAKASREKFDFLRKEALKMRFRSGSTSASVSARTSQDMRIKNYLEKTRLMDQEILATPEEAYFQIAAFCPTRMRAYSRRLVEEIRAALKPGDYDGARKLIEELVDSVRAETDVVECGDTLAFAGLVEYQMGEYPRAASLLARAMRKYPPRCHQQVLSTWMLAMIYLRAGSRENATGSIEKALEGMRTLSHQANHENKQAARAWYETRIEIMQAIKNNL